MDSPDETTRKIELLTCVSAYGEWPLNLSLQQVWSAGKTFTITTIADHFQNVWFLGGLSPKALIHQKGSYDEDADRFMIDLNNKIIIFLDEPQFYTLMMLKPLLSHDRYEIEYRYVDKQGKTVTSTLRGWPSVIFCAVQSKYTMEYASRWLTASPETSLEKIKKVVELKGDMATHPEKYEKGKNFKVWKKVFNILKQSAPHRVIIPYANILSKHFRPKKPEHMRFYELFLGLIKASTILHSMQRQKDQYGRLQATLEDYEIAYNIFTEIERPTVYGLGVNVLDFYDNVMTTAIPTNLDYATYKSLMEKYHEIYGEPISRDHLRSSYLKPLIRKGLVDLTDDPEDKRKKRIVTTSTTAPPSLIDNEGFIKEIKK